MTPEILNQVPWSAVMPALPQTLLIALSGSVFLASLYFVFLETRRRGDWVAVYAFLGGGLAVIYEPVGDMLVSALYPVNAQVGWISLFGRQIPLFIGLLYFWYMSIPAIYFLKRMETGISRGELWRLYFSTMAVVIAIELFGVNVDAWIYYGNQPFVLFGVPLWATFTYGGFVIAISAGLYLLTRVLNRDYHFLIVPAIPLFLVGSHCTLSLPAAGAMFSTDNAGLIWLGGAVSILFSLLFVHGVATVVCQRGGVLSQGGGRSAVAL